MSGYKANQQSSARPVNSIPITDGKPQESVCELQYNTNRQLLGASTWDCKLTFWKIEDNYSKFQKKNVYNIEKLRNVILRFAFHEKNDSVYCGLSDGSVRKIPNINTAEEPVEFKSNGQPLKHNGIITGLIIKDDLLITSSANLDLILTDLNSGEKITDVPLSDKPTSLCLSNDQNYVYCAQNTDGITSFDLRNPKINLKAWETKEILSFPTTQIAPCGENGFIVSTIFGLCCCADSYTSPAVPIECFRDYGTPKMIFPANSVTTIYSPPNHNYAIMGGGNGCINITNLNDKSKQRECQIGSSRSRGPLSVTRVCALGNQDPFVAVATGYDWQKGVEPQKGIVFDYNIFIHNFGSEIPK